MKYYYLKRHKGIFYYLKYGKRKYGYRYTYYDDNHKRHEKSSRGFDTQKEAIQQQNKIAQRYSSINEKNINDTTFKQWCDNYLQRIKPITKITTYKSYYNLLNHSVIPYIGNVKLVNLVPMIYKTRCLSKLFKQGLRRKSIIDINARVQAVMNDAAVNTSLTQNKLAHISIPHNNRSHKKEIMNDKQLTKFNNCLNHHSLQVQVIYYTLEQTGLRCGELLGAHWNCISFNNRTFHVKYTRDEYGERSPKTLKSNRIITIDQGLVNLLVKYKHYCQKKFHITNKSHVILGKHGKPLTPLLVSVELKKLLNEAGLHNMVNHFTPHSFRHMIISRLIDLGVKPTLVSKMVGHSSIRETLDVYAQSAPDEHIDMDKVMDEIYRKKHN